MTASAPAVVDLNADLGESYGDWSMGDDAAILDVVTTANVACGGHAGDGRSMRTACRAAAARGVAITAHVAYPDLQGFGRRFLDIAPDDLVDQVVVQVGALQAMARAEGTQVRGTALIAAVDRFDSTTRSHTTRRRRRRWCGRSASSGRSRWSPRPAQWFSRRPGRQGSRWSSRASPTAPISPAAP